MFKASTMRKTLHRTGGFSLLENVFACAVICLFLAGTFTANSESMSILRMGRDEAGASQVLQQRIEQLRIANWQAITGSTWIRDNILNKDADGSANLQGVIEGISITPYNGLTTATNQFSRTLGTATANGGNSSLIAESAIKVTWTVTWSGLPKGRIHTRQNVAILGLGGVAK